ncbi:hypothetical protein MMC24_000071 [Lignoscripta atroalba]|nr:hypothetical protein [Lignoscripta atroalba]
MEKLASAIKIESTPKPIQHVKPITNDDDVRILGVDEYKQAAQCLAEAFAEDEVAQYFIETGDRDHWSAEDKWNLHVDILDYVVYAHCLKGLVLTTGPDYGCVALWMPPGHNMDDWSTMFRSGMWRLHYKLSAEGKRRFFTEFLPLLHETKREILGDQDDESWYLVYLGTKPAARGKGYARKLIDFVTKKADAEGRACYLESSNGINPVIYGKMGFQIKKTIHLTRGEEPIELDIMVREPVKAMSG